MSDNQLNIRLTALERTYSVPVLGKTLSQRPRLRVKFATVYIEDTTSDECVPQIHMDFIDRFNEFGNLYHMDWLAREFQKILKEAYDITVELDWMEPQEFSGGLLMNYEHSTDELSQLISRGTMPVGSNPELDSKRLKVMLDWYLRNGLRSEIHPYGHMTATTEKDILGFCDNKIKEPQ